MAIPTTFAQLKNSDFTLRPIDVYKRFRISASDLQTTGSGYALVKGVYSGYITPIGSQKANNDPTNTVDNSYQHVIWKHIDHLYYRHPYDSTATFEHSNRRYTFKHLTPSASLLSIPYFDYGVSIKPGSVQISSSAYLDDDGNGNIYDKSIDTGSFAINSDLVGYWGFNDYYRLAKFETARIEYDLADYHSNTFTPPDQVTLKNVYTRRGVVVSQSLASGLQATFLSTGYILTPFKREFNFTSDRDFTLSCWIQAPTSQSVVTHDENAILTKRGVVFKDRAGIFLKQRPSGLNVNARYITSSYVDSETDVYPYDITIFNQQSTDSGKIKFARSNGTSTLVLTSSAALNDNTHHHICVTKSGSLYSLYVDGALQGSSIYRKDGYCVNDHSLMFGSLDRNLKQAYSGSIDEVRLYEYGASAATVATLASTQSLYQTPVVGNAFYRKGNIVITSLDPNYQNVLHDPSLQLTFRGTHTIYQYEALCRVRKGDFNLTLNPTARTSPYSDILADDMTGSLLRPYATTIGLYNDKNELVAVGKLGQPIQMRDDVDINFLVRWDS